MSTKLPAPRTISDEDDRPGGLPFEDFLRRFFDKRGDGMPETGREFVGLGSGFIVDPQGYIVTNNHVVSKAEKITVILQDNSRHEAKVIGRDEKTDLALIKIDAKEQLPFVTWGDSDQAKVGDWVVAVGNPFGLGGTVTAGIVSAVGRNINEGPYDEYMQIDAPINRGNSGGPDLQSRRRGDRGQYRDLLALGRLGRDRLRGSLEHREERRPAAQGKRPCDARLARASRSRASRRRSPRAWGSIPNSRAARWSPR